MAPWSLERLERMLADLGQVGDPEDPRARKRGRILRAAAQLFAKHGYRKTSIEDVARRAGLAKGTVYLYFKNKAELLMHAVGEEKRVALARVRPILEGALGPCERLRRYVSTSLLVAVEMPISSRLLAGDDELAAAMADLDPDVREQMARLRVEFFSALVGDAAAGLPAAEIADRGAVLATLLLRAPIFDAELRGGLSLERYAAVLADVVVGGIVAPASDPTVAPAADPTVVARGADHG